MEEKTKKELIWKELKNIKKGSRINMLQMSKDVECSLAYVSSTARYAYEAKFLKFDDTGNYVIKHIPSYSKFQEGVNAKYATYRSSSKVSPRGQGSRKKVPQTFEFKANEESILAIIKALINAKTEMAEKYNKLLKYTKIVKKERDELLDNFNEMEI